MTDQAYVYILASRKHGTLYIGVTSNLVQRVWQHKHNEFEGFTSKYSVHHLVYYEMTESIITAIEREKQLKKWNRQWKVNLIEKMNPEWRDLFEDLI